MLKAPTQGDCRLSAADCGEYRELAGAIKPPPHRTWGVR